jgi:hypothetical protein
MNDYYPYLAARVSTLESSSESRHEIYKSTREELATKLASPTLRVPESEIAKECRAFDAAIQKIETEMEREGISDARALDPKISRTFTDCSVTAKITSIEPENILAMCVSESSPETSSPTTPRTLELAASAEQKGKKGQPEGELLQATPTGRPSPARDFGALPRDAAHDSVRNLTPPGALVAQAVPKRLISLILMIVICSLVFAFFFFSTSIGKWLGI